ncbi:hypothetical protein AGMMS49525_02350 [Bacteroidia bacterium]|nr:hypothetical protein AGMMS49525_02350 [Bacteroidia bacterium]
MKEYKDFSESEPSIVSDVAVAYEVTQSQPSFFAPFYNSVDDDIPLDATGRPIGYSLEDFSGKLLDKLSKAYGVDFRKL